MLSLVNSQITLNADNLPKSCVLIDQNTINGLTNKILDILENDLINKTKYDDNDIRRLFDIEQTKLNNLEAKIKCVNINNDVYQNPKQMADAYGVEIEKLNAENLEKTEIIQQYMGQLKLLDKLFTRNKNQNMADKFDLADWDADKVNKMDESMNIVQSLNKKIQNIWTLLLTDICNDDEINAINNEFGLANDAISKKIHERYSEKDYFYDLFEELSTQKLEVIHHNKYWQLQDKLFQYIASTHTPLITTIKNKLDESKIEATTMEFIPIKAKFSTEQLTNNYDSLNIDLQKFAQLEVSEMAPEELTEIVAQYQIKVKKYQAITRELHNRHINATTSHHNMLYNISDLCKTNHSIVELYKDAIAYIIPTEVLCSKWNLLKSIINSQHGPAMDKNHEKLKTAIENNVVKLQLECDILHKQISDLVDKKNICDMYVEIEDIKSKLAHFQNMYSSNDTIKLLQQYRIDNSTLIDIKSDLQPIVLNVAPQLDTLNQILDNQEMIKKALQVRNNNVAPVFLPPVILPKEISSVGTFDSNDDNESECVNCDETESDTDGDADESNSDVDESNADEPVDKSVDEPVNKSVDDPVDEPANADESVNESNLDKSVDDPVNESIDESKTDEPKAIQIVPVATIKDATELYNVPDVITEIQSNTTYFCKACNKNLTFTGSKPANHCKTAMHSKRFLQWLNDNKLITK